MNSSRRAFLRTATGAFALPWMESISGAGELVKGSATTGGPPRRFVTLFFPNGVYPHAWQARMDEGRLRFGGSLAPLQAFADRSVVVTGLNNPLGGHLGQTSGFLSGRDFEPNAQGVVTGATSLDQMLAQHWGHETFLPSLNLALEPPSQGGFGNKPKSYGNSISWSSPDNKIEPQINPRQAFDQVFFGQTEAGRKAAARRRRIVDQVWTQAKSLQQRVSQLDRQKVDQYLDSIRDLEVKLDKAMNPQERAWIPPTSADLSHPPPSGIPGSYPEHMKLMMEIMLLALQTDSTRVSTLVMGHSISRVVYDFIDPKLKRNHHDFSHHRNDPEKIDGYNQITAWFARQSAWLLEQMDAIDEGNGSLLENSLVLYGSGMKDGNVHEGNNVPVALFGGAGGKLKTHRLIENPEGSVLSQLHLSLLHLHGIEADDFNGVTSKTVSGLG